MAIEKKNEVYEPIYLELKRIYESALQVIVNGKPYKHAQPLKALIDKIVRIYEIEEV